MVQEMELIFNVAALDNYLRVSYSAILSSWILSPIILNSIDHNIIHNVV